MANELNIGVRFSPEGMPQVAKAVAQLDQQLDKFQTGISNTASTLKSELGPSLQRATQNIDRFKAGLKVDPTAQTSLLNVSNKLQNVEASARSAAAGVNTFKNATGAGMGVVTDFSRVVQDLPFGFLGIANNLTQLPGGFQRLSAAAKESGKSIGSILLSSVSGFGGIGLALSLLTSGLLIAQNGIAGFGRASKKAKEDADELAKTIRSIGEIQAEATGGAQGEIAQVNALALAISDSNKPYGERKRALEELKQINKAYFGDLQLEDEATGKLAKSVDEYTKALVANAIVKSFVNEIAEVAKAASKADEELTKATQRLTNAEKDLASARANRSGGGREGTAQTFEEAHANAALLKAFEQQRAQREKVTDLLTQQVVLQNALNKAQANALQFKDTGTKKTEQEKDFLNEQLKLLEKIREARQNIRPERSFAGILDLDKLGSDVSELAKIETEIGGLRIKIAERDAKKAKLPPEQIKALVEGIKKDTQDNLNKIFQNEAILLEGIPKIKFSKVELDPLKLEEIESEIAKATGFDKKIPIKTDREVLIELFGIEFVLAKEKTEAAIKQLKETILNSTVSALSDTASLFGETLGAIFSGEGIGSAIAKAANGLLTIIGNALQQIGKQIIATSTLVETLKKALDSLFAPGGTALGFAVGAALVALGGLMKSIKIPGFASGVNNFSGGLAVVGERGPELVNLPRGSDVIPNHMLGGGDLRVVVEVAGVVSGDNIRLVGQRTEQKRRRI